MKKGGGGSGDAGAGGEAGKKHIMGCLCCRVGGGGVMVWPRPVFVWGGSLHTPPHVCQHRSQTCTDCVCREK